MATADGGARATRLHTRRGIIETPAFMPVATHAHVRLLTMDEVAASGAQMCLANTYHLLLRPGPGVFERTKGIHDFMQWSGGVLTDSGGFQIFSLPGERELSEEGARFRSPYDNHPHLLSPESSVAMQQAIGSDIMMVLDECIPSTADEATTRAAMERTHRWARRSLAERDAKDTGQALFAIVQGGVFEHLRRESAQALTEHPFDGFAIGGLAVGESREQLYEMAGLTAKLLPVDRPRYLMGVGTPIDLVEAVHRGVDLFDCILPGKMAQQGYAYTFEGQLRLSRAEYTHAEAPLDASCRCPVCRRYSRAYLRHLTQSGHHLGGRLLAVHNQWHYQGLMQRIRTAIVEGRWEAELRALRDALAPKAPQPKPAGLAAGEFELVTLKSGARAVRHRGHGEVMHPVGPWEEANRLYVEQTGLVRRLLSRVDVPLRVLDVGLGAAANAVAALSAAAAMPTRSRPLEVWSLEVSLDPLRLALDDPKGFPFLEPWREACQALLQHGVWEGRGLSWHLALGDARAQLSELDGFFDLTFFDPFSPEANPELWTVEALRAVLSRSKREDSLLATYSTATPTRVALLLAGYFVGHGVPTGTREETTIAATRLEHLAQPLGERWLERWRRSTARGPHGSPFSPEIERAVLSHAQFAGRGGAL